MILSLKALRQALCGLMALCFQSKFELSLCSLPVTAPTQLELLCRIVIRVTLLNQCSHLLLDHDTGSLR